MQDKAPGRGRKRGKRCEGRGEREVAIFYYRLYQPVRGGTGKGEEGGATALQLDLPTEGEKKLGKSEGEQKKKRMSTEKTITPHWCG